MIWQPKAIHRFTHALLLLTILSTGGWASEVFSKATSGSCTSQNPAVNVIFAPGNGQNMIYGDGLSIYNNPNDATFNGGTLYTQGVFNVCSGSNDLTLNLSSTSRHMIVDFYQLLTMPAPGANDVTNHEYSSTFMNIRNVYSLQTIGGSMNTCVLGNFNYNKTTTYNLRFDNPSPYASACPSDNVINTGGDTAVIAVSHPDACTWLVLPVADAAGHYRGGISETVNKATVAGGQYNLPFAIKLVLSSPSCPLN